VRSTTAAPAAFVFTTPPTATTPPGRIAKSPKPLDVVANHRGLPTTTTEVWAEARLGWRASFGPRRL
jgi:hypothetical protein